MMVLVCLTCEQRFSLDVRRAPEHPTCSVSCCEAHEKRLANHRRLVTWSQGAMPCGPQPPNRIADALAETRAAVERLLAEGRAAERAS